jgi:Flp pilus assembly protein TadG
MFTVLMTPVIFLLAGLVVDLGLAIHDRQYAYGIADQTARAGANQIDPTALRNGQLQLDSAQVPGACADFLSHYTAQHRTQVTGSCEQVQGTQTVKATVSIRWTPDFLSILPGVGSVTITVSATAQPVEGN